ncbi:MAG: hypothetical protein ACPGYV_13710 [Phycisphaeraceae bacterium]
MQKSFSKVTVRIVSASLLVLAMSMPTMAQIGREPVESPPESGAWKAFLLAIFFLGAVAMACLMTPKRSHLD